MQYADRHPYRPDATFDGGALDCGNGLLLLIRKHIDPLRQGQFLEIQSAEPSVEEDLPAWCRLTNNALVSCTRSEGRWSYLVAKGGLPPGSSTAAAGAANARVQMPLPAGFKLKSVAPEGVGSGASGGAFPSGAWERGESGAWERGEHKTEAQSGLPSIASAPAIAPLSVMGIGSWPRPRWMVAATHEHLEGRLSEAEFQATADDAVRLCVAAQLRAGVDVLTDGEQRRDSYAAFVGGRLDNCQLIPIADLLPYVTDPDEFRRELESLDVPANSVRHPAVFGRLGRSRPIAAHESQFLRTLADKPIKVALPGPYLLTRTMWMECISDRAYENRETLADDVVRVLREELYALLADGVALVQFDEPVLTEVVFGRAGGNRTFMCGALGAKRPAEEELQFALGLINRVVAGVPPERTALHVCRGNWSPDESVALSGDYRPLLPVLKNVEVGTLMLELCTPRAGELEVLKQLPERLRIGVGVVNQKSPQVEPVAEIRARAEHAVELFGRERVLLNPDCGFATFADNPVSSSEIAEAKLAAIVAASRELRE